ncbi:MAG: two-component regulator propeller domain-containing protein, partial [Acidobacteriota bacterium]
MRSRNPDARRIHPARRSPGASASPRRAAALLAGCLLAGALAAGPPIAASSPPAEPAPVADFRLGVEDGLPSIYPTCALRDRVGFLWICTDRGLTRWDGHRALVLEHDPADGRSLSSARVHRLLQDRSNHLWVGTDSGLDRFDRESLEFQRYPIDDVASGVGQRRVTAMEEAAPGRFWVGTLGGLYLFDSRDRSYAAVEALRGLTVRSLALDRRGALWAATAQGVFTVESRLEARPALEQSPELGEAAVLSLAVDSEDRLWLGTDRGVWRVDLPSSGEAVHLPGTRGAVTDLAFGVRGSSLFYAASRLGLFRASRSGSSPPARLGPAEGWLAFDSDSGIAWSSGQGAVLGFQAEAAARTRARVIFTGLEIDGQPVLPGAGDGLIARDISTALSLDLPGEFRRLAIDLSTLDLAGLDDSRFVYRLVGFGDPWHATGGRWARAVYGPLPPGEYTLEVKAASGVGPEGETLWSEARTLALNVRQLKGGWRTWAVLGALAAVIAGLVVRARSSRRRQTRALDLRLRELQQQKLESLSTLAGGVAHDFNNLLVGIFGHAELAKLQLPEDSPATQHLERIVASGRRAAELAKQMLFYSGRGNFLIEPLDVSSLAQEVGDSLRSSLPDGVQLLVEASPRVPPLEGDPGQLRQVLTHLVTNAAESLEDREGFIVIGTGVRLVDEAFLREHGLADRLTVGEYVTLTVDDTGRGIDEESLERIFEPFF